MVPGFGIASEVIPVFSRKPIFGYPLMVAATVSIPRGRAEADTRNS